MTLLDITYEERQTLVGQSARDVFRRRAPMTAVRELERSDAGYSPELWREIAGLGWLGISIPEQYGGSGAGFLDLMPIFEEIGRALIAGPHVDTVGVATGLLLDVGTDAQKTEYLPAIASGDLAVSLATFEPNGGYGPASVTLEARAAGSAGSAYTLHGTKLLVGFAPSVQRLLVAGRTGAGSGANGISLFLVDPKAAGISTTKLDVIPGVALYEVSFNGVEVAGSDVVGGVGSGWRPLATNMTKAAVLQTSTIVGAGRAVLEFTSQYAKDRHQFDIPIGKNQAVQYMVSDVLLDVHRTDLLARQAAFRIDAGLPYAREAAMAVAFGKEAAAHFHRQAHEVHAGVAFIDEHDLTLFSRRSKHWETHLGDARYYHELLAEAIEL